LPALPGRKAKPGDTAAEPVPEAELEPEPEMAHSASDEETDGLLTPDNIMAAFAQAGKTSGSDEDELDADDDTDDGYRPLTAMVLKTAFITASESAKDKKQPKHHTEFRFNDEAGNHRNVISYDTKGDDLTTADLQRLAIRHCWDICPGPLGAFKRP
jgi:hypothetical protein